MTGLLFARRRRCRWLPALGVTLNPLSKGSTSLGYSARAGTKAPHCTPWARGTPPPSSARGRKDSITSVVVSWRSSTCGGGPRPFACLGRLLACRLPAALARLIARRSRSPACLLACLPACLLVCFLACWLLLACSLACLPACAPACLLVCLLLAACFLLALLLACLLACVFVCLLGCVVASLLL